MPTDRQKMNAALTASGLDFESTDDPAKNFNDLPEGTVKALAVVLHNTNNLYAVFCYDDAEDTVEGGIVVRERF